MKFTYTFDDGWRINNSIMVIHLNIRYDDNKTNHQESKV